MRQRKHEREQKRQRGQFMTPPTVVRQVLDNVAISHPSRILEPSCGNGRFLRGLQSILCPPRTGQNGTISAQSVVGIEIDPVLARAIDADSCTPNVEVHVGDFFRWYLTRRSIQAEVRRGENPLDGQFDLIVGNPPFGGTFDHAIEDELDRLLGHRLGRKIKKETYAFFIVSCIDLLHDGGQLLFVCSDTLLTIPTMTGLRQYLMEHGSVELTDLRKFSAETTYPMVILNFRKCSEPDTPRTVTRNGEYVCNAGIRRTPNLSWSITPEFARLFTGPLLSDYFIASSGMTTGKNEYFVREIDHTGYIEEPYHFRFADEKVTVAYELERARLCRLPAKVRRALEEAEARGDVQRRLRVEPRVAPVQLRYPDPDYAPYNKANNRIIFSDPTHAIFWKDDGDAVLTYKKTGNWYLRGVGGQPYFKQEGLTWQLVASRFVPRYLLPGYILDSGAPCAFPLKGTERDEMYFVLGWLLSPLANRVLKSVINHTRNIQSKDFERMPYPWWVSRTTRQSVIDRVKSMIEAGQSGKQWTWKDGDIRSLGDRFEFDETAAHTPQGNVAAVRMARRPQATVTEASLFIEA